MPDQEIDITFGTSKAYAPHVAAVIASIVRHAPDARLRFIILHEGITPERQSMMESVAPNARFYWGEIRDDDLPPYADNSHFSRAILYRLGLEKLAPPDCRRVLYLDADVIVLADVRRIYGMDLEGAPIGAIIDSHYLDGAGFAERWALAPSSLGYFNSGVMMIDLDRVRAEKLFSKAIELVAREGAEFRFADQDALNIVTWDRWHKLPPSWNVQRDMVISSLAEQLPKELRFCDTLPDLVQYTGPEKPWTLEGYHPWFWLYWDVLAETPFFREVASRERIGLLQRLRLWLRWQRRKPRG